MKIAVMVAMDKELSLFKPLIENDTEIEIEGLKAHQGKVGNHEVLLCKCGIGKVNAALNTHRIIKNFGPELVINTGVAGGAGSTMRIGQLLVADKAAYHDVWCGPGTITGQADGEPLFFEAYTPVIEETKKVCNPATFKVGLICTGDRFISRHEEVVAIKDSFPEVCAVDMESAAIAHVCHDCGIPFNILRVVSDTPGKGENLEQYQNFWSDAPQTTFAALRQIIHNL